MHHALIFRLLACAGLAASTAGCTQRPAPPLVHEALSGLTQPDSATLFAPGIVSTDADDLMIAFDPNGRDVYFVRRRGQAPFAIMSASVTAGKWSPPALLSFSGTYSDQSPFVSPDGRQLFFQSDRPVNGEDRRTDLWVVARNPNGWASPTNLGTNINTPELERDPSVDSSGTLYFWSTGRGGSGNSDLFRARWSANGYAEPENLGPVLNTAAWEANPVISPSGDYLLFTSDDRPDGYGRADIYITYWRNGAWTTPVNLGPKVNSPAFDFAPRFSPDGRFLFFSSNRAGNQDVYYIATRSLALDPARP